MQANIIFLLIAVCAAVTPIEALFEAIANQHPPSTPQDWEHHL